MPLESLPPDQRLPISRSFRHLLVFQLKLFVDAFRDFVFSPLSLAAFVIDSLTQPKVKDSLSLRLMDLGQKSDHAINLFNAYTNEGDYTIDETVKEVETALQKEMEKRQRARSQTVSEE